MMNLLILLLFLLCVTLFFWGIVKTVKTQRKIYLVAILPFILLIAGMFLL